MASSLAGFTFMPSHTINTARDKKMIKTFFKFEYKNIFILFLVLITQSKLICASEVDIKDALDRPARSFSDATNSMQLAITQAGLRIVSVGEKGVVLLSDDEGSSWRQAKFVPVSVTLTGVQFVNDKTGFAIGHSGVLLMTLDGGEHWVVKVDGRGLGDLYMKQALSLSESDDKTQAISNAGFIIQDGADKPLLDIFINVDNHIYVTGAYGLALKSVDGGDHWAPFSLEIPNTDSMHLYSYRFSNGHEFIVGERGSFFDRIDSDNFQSISSPYNGSFFGSIDGGKDNLFLYGLRGNIWNYNVINSQWLKLDYPFDNSITSGIYLKKGKGFVFSDAGGNIVKLLDDQVRNFELIENVGTYVTGMTLNNSYIILSTIRGNKRIKVD